MLSLMLQLCSVEAHYYSPTQHSPLFIFMI
jgi:hypothetical protein